MASPHPLPRPNNFHPDNQSVVYTAYEMCLDLESRHDQVSKIPQVRITALICARLLGYMIREAPTTEGREDFSWEVKRCQPDTDINMPFHLRRQRTDAALLELAQLYNDHLLRIFRSNKGPTPTPRSHPSAPSSDVQKAALGTFVVNTPAKDKAKENVLYRDGYRCVITKQLDFASYKENRVTPKLDDKATVTEVAHIFSRSTNEDLENKQKSAYAASVHAVLLRFGQLRAFEELNGPGLYRLQNLFTLNVMLHRLFDSLDLWFERSEDDPDNEYRMGGTDPIIFRELPQVVAFSSPDKDKFPLPDPRYLALHAACARVAHLSGAGEYNAMILRDIEAIGVLPKDGSSDALYYALVRSVDVTV